MSQPLTNAQIFKAIGLDDSVNPTSKYTLMICAHVLMDWKERAAHLSADQIATASSQSSRQVKRHLKALVEAGWLTRHAEVRGPGLHHKSHTTLNQDKVRAILSGAHDVTELVKPDVTELVSTPPQAVTELVSPDVTELVSPDVTELVKPDVTELVDTKSVTPPVTELVSSDVTELVKPLPKVSHISISLNNNNQSIINREEPEDRMDPTREDYLQEGWVWCERCKAWTPKDEPHFYPNTDIECSEAQPTPEQVKAMEWDQAWGKHSPEVEEPVERRDGFIYYLNEIPDELTYKREVMRVIDHYDRYDVRLLLWNRREGDALFTRMMRELIAPRSCIEWVTIQAGGEISSATEPPPPKPSKTYTVTVDQQRKIKEIDQAWMTGATNGGNDSW